MLKKSHISFVVNNRVPGSLTPNTQILEGNDQHTYMTCDTWMLSWLQLGYTI